MLLFATTFTFITPGIASLSLFATIFALLALNIVSSYCCYYLLLRLLLLLRVLPYYCYLLLYLLFCFKYCLIVIIITTRGKKKNLKLLSDLLEPSTKKIWTRVKDKYDNIDQFVIAPRCYNTFNKYVSAILSPLVLPSKMPSPDQYRIRNCYSTLLILLNK